MTSALCVSCAQQPQSSGRPATTAVRRARATIVPTHSPALAPPVASTDSAPLPAAGTSAPPPGGPSSPPASGPAIYSVNATPAVVHGGDSVEWDVRTSPDVVSVAAHVAAITLPMRRVSAGHFGLTFAVPTGVPFFFHGRYHLDVRALTARGETLHRAIVLTFS